MNYSKSYLSELSNKTDFIKDNLEKVESINFMKFKTQLKPVITKKDKFDVNEAKEIVIKYLKELIIFDESELLFIKEFRNGNYQPELLFEDENIIMNIKAHPMALWRCRK